MVYSTLDPVHDPTVRDIGVRARRIGTAVLTLFVLAGLETDGQISFFRSDERHG